QIGPAQWKLTLAALLIEGADPLFTAVFFACQSLELMAREGMEGMRDPKLLGLHSTNGCSLMPFSLIPSIPRTRAVPQAQELRYELQGCNQCRNSTRFHQSSIKPPKMSLNTPKPPTVKSLILLGLRVGGFGSFGLKAIRNRQAAGSSPALGSK